MKERNAERIGRIEILVKKIRIMGRCACGWGERKRKEEKRERRK